jgi:hypothetical protein
MIRAFCSAPLPSLILPNAGIAGVAVFLAIGFLISTVRPTRRQLIWIWRRSTLSTACLTGLAGIVAVTLWHRTLLAGRTDPFIYFQF